MTWQINGHWEFDPDPSHASEIEVRFTAVGPEQTAVTLEHRHLDRLVDGKAIQDTTVERGGGWSTLLELFAETAQSS
ncbi:SRPBCC domain-containing protein [Nocardia ignorata]|uniref:SRPBCC domain-containing protein n=1 Tax=Nocardia ignorata TaxID=145285 RepID=UPI003530D776